jgi:hypothetical protein
VPFEHRWDPRWNADAWGWYPSGHDAELASLALTRTTRTFVPLLEGFRLSPRLLTVVRQTLELARDAGVRAALVVMPEGPTFRGLYPPGAWQQIEAALTELSRAAGVPLLDFRTAVAESGFSDSHHLYADAASRFSQPLARRIEPLLRGTSAPAGNLMDERSCDARR